MDLTLLRQSYVKHAMRNYMDNKPLRVMYDAGAGYCQYSWYVLNRWQNSRVHASDLKRDYLESFHDFLSPAVRHRFSYSAADLQYYVPQGYFELITAVDILEHIPDDLAVMRNFHTCLSQNGILIISTPSDLDEAARFTEEHVRPGYRKQELEGKLRSAGFTILESLYSYGKWGSLAWRILIKKPMQMLTYNKLITILIPLYIMFIYPFALILMKLDMLLPNPAGTGLIVVATKE
jgi:trans-aconitate methyltransferase